MIPIRVSRRTIATSIIAVAFAFGLLVSPLLALNAMCPMPCCRHGKTAAMQMPMCPLPQQCPEVSRDLEESAPVSAAPAPAQPVVHAVPAVVAVVVSAPAARDVASDDVSPASPTSERPLYLVDSVFLI